MKTQKKDKHQQTIAGVEAPSNLVRPGPLSFLPAAECQKRLNQWPEIPGFIQAWDRGYAQGNFGQWVNPIGWADCQIRQGDWPPGVQAPPLAPVGNGGKFVRPLPQLVLA